MNINKNINKAALGNSVYLSYIKLHERVENPNYTNVNVTLNLDTLKEEFLII